MNGPLTEAQLAADYEHAADAGPDTICGRCRARPEYGPMGDTYSFAGNPDFFSCVCGRVMTLTKPTHGGLRLP